MYSLKSPLGYIYMYYDKGGGFGGRGGKVCAAGDEVEKPRETKTTKWIRLYSECTV